VCRFKAQAVHYMCLYNLFAVSYPDVSTLFLSKFFLVQYNPAAPDVSVGDLELFSALYYFVSFLHCRPVLGQAI
jgi:hypothetical protein